MKRWLLVPVLWVLAACAAAGILEEGADLIEKPFTPSSFAEKVRKVLGA